MCRRIVRIRARGRPPDDEEAEVDVGPLVLELQLGLDGDGEEGQCASNVKHGVEGVTMTVGMGEFIVSRLRWDQRGKARSGSGSGGDD